MLALLLAGREARQSLPRVLDSLALATVVVTGLQRVVARPRPFDADPRVRPLISQNSGPSFPSRHVASAFAMAVSGMRGARRIGGLMLAGGVLLAVSRVYVGVHYPSDVLAGALVGAICGWLGSRR